MISAVYSPFFIFSFIWVAMGAVTAFGLTYSDNEPNRLIPSSIFILAFFFWPVFIFAYFVITLLTAVHKAIEAFRLVWIQISYGKMSFWAILKDLSKDKK